MLSASITTAQEILKIIFKLVVQILREFKLVHKRKVFFLFTSKTENQCCTAQLGGFCSLEYSFNSFPICFETSYIERCSRA